MHTTWWLMTGGAGGGGGGGGVGGCAIATDPTMARARRVKVLLSCMLIAVVVILWTWKF
jgi:hypothetical protein